MSWPKFVCPHNRDLLQSFRDRTVVVRVQDLDAAVAAASDVYESGNHLLCVLVESDSPLADLDFSEAHYDLPLAVMAPSCGRFRHLAGRLGLLRGLNLRVYLPGSPPENLVGLRILSSVGIHTSVVIDRGVNWEALADLMTYAVLERAPHAPIEPFAYIASHYDPPCRLEWGGLFFDAPEDYLHLDDQGRVALSSAELLEQRFFAQSISDIAKPDKYPATRERLQERRQHFEDNHPCLSCGGWAICLGKFAAADAGNQGCTGFFLEMVEVARTFKARQNKTGKLQIWQP
jgi:hypothetical protein